MEFEKLAAIALCSPVISPQEPRNHHGGIYRIALLQQQQAEQQSLKAKKSDTPPEWLRHRPPGQRSQSNQRARSPSSLC